MKTHVADTLDLTSAMSSKAASTALFGPSANLWGLEATELVHAMKTITAALNAKGLKKDRILNLIATNDGTLGLVPPAPGRPLPLAPAAPTAAPRTGRFQPRGDFWIAGYGDSIAVVRNSKGLGYIAYLLRYPGREVHVLDLVTFCDFACPGRRAGDFDGAEVGGGPAERLDVQAMREYRHRIRELKEDLVVVKDLGNEDKALRIEEEIDQLDEELKSALGSHRFIRKAPAYAERARVNVTRAIRIAIGRIGGLCEELGRHLDSHIRTGGYCSYRVGDESIEWQL